jgi:Tfp pilus assembly protein FimT
MEVVLITILLAVVATIAIPRLNFAGIHVAEVKTTAQAFAGQLRLARSLAIANAGANNQGYNVTIGAGAYSLIDADTLATVKGPIDIPDGIVTSGNTSIGFNPLGESADGNAKATTFRYSTTSAVVTVTPVGGITVN